MGANIGEVTLEIHSYFPDAAVFGFEPVAEYFQRARAATQHLPGVSMVHGALSYQHLFADDLGQVRRPQKAPLRILQAQEGSGPGWRGGSMTLPSDHGWVQRGGHSGYSLLSSDLWPLTLEEVYEVTGWDSIDLMKLDCEGSENSILGCAGGLERVRFIVGEYHGIERFYRVMKGKLFKTHKVNLIGDSDLGAFFAERLEGERDGILKYDKTGMNQVRRWLSPEPLDWHLFNEQHVPVRERWIHGLPVA